MYYKRERYHQKKNTIGIRDKKYQKNLKIWSLFSKLILLTLVFFFICRASFGKFIYQFQPDTKTLIRKPERILNTLYGQNLFYLLNKTCINQQCCLNTHTHTHTHTHIYIYIYTYIYIYKKITELLPEGKNFCKQVNKKWKCTVNAISKPLCLK